ncbi:serine-enriched protein isoform X1 [Osmia lignaria lignaria]|uniref:serine-enriched protein isoform X1 n=1 Tax=Osmia lignaria lignaria TaxID=1437193 RepID=UPI0014782C7A|nr:serine-enriched protein isoform X1 [Osmia lignaria]
MPEASGSGVADEADYSTFENKTGLAEDMKFLASMPELCDVTFLVGDTREPVCAVKAVLAARSRVFHKMLYQAPSPQRKKDPPPRENKLRQFLKRSSEPLLNLQNVAQQRSGFTQQLAPIQEPNQHHTLIIEEFEPDVFRQLIEYIHTGCVTLQPRTLLGVMNAADYYGLDELRRACAGFVQCCITVDTVCALLASAERYIQYKCTKSLVQKVLEFVDEHGNEVLNLGSFTLLPQHVVRLILAREELRADEFTKFQAALMWSKKFCDSNQNTVLKDVIGNFLEYIQFHKIPANVLMREVHPLGLVPSGIIVTALAYQADPTSVDPGKLSPHRVRHQDRSLSVQSSLQDPYGSNTSLSSTGSDEGSDYKQHSGKNGTADQLHWQKENDEDSQQRMEIRLEQEQQRQLEELRKRHEDLEKKREEKELKKRRAKEEREQRQQQKKQEEEDSKKEKDTTEEEKKGENEESKQQQDEQEMADSKEQLQKEEESKRKEEEEESMKQQILQKEQEEQRRIREKMRLQLQLEELKVHWALQQELILQQQEEVLQRQIEERRCEEQFECPQFQQLQLYLEGRKPEPKKQEPKVEKSGFYIKLVVRQEGRPNLVWLFKTHKF